MTNKLKYLLLVLLSLLNIINAMLMFASPPWFNVFAGSLLAIIIPFWTAMVFVAKHNNVRDSESLKNEPV